MPLADYGHAKRKILFPGGDFEVRAINLRDVSILIDVHRSAIDQIVASIRAARDMESFTEADVIAEVILEVIRESPILVGNIIAMCADEPNEQEQAMNLPISIQMEALQGIADLTFTDAAAVKKFSAGVMNLIQGLLPPKTEALAAE